MSSYEDISGFAASVYDALKHLQWRAPGHWELDSIIEPVTDQILLKLSDTRYLAASPTLAAPTNIRAFLTSLYEFADSPLQLVPILSFLLLVPVFSTFLVAALTNVNIVLKALRLPLASKPVRASPVLVILLMVTVFGNIPLVDLVPDHLRPVQGPSIVRLGHYTGLIASMLHFAVYYECFELTSLFLLDLFRRTRSRSKPRATTTFVIWLLRAVGFALRIWITRVSTDTATNQVQSGSTVWLWRKVVLRTDVHYQTKNEFNEDLIAWSTYFAVTFFASLVVSRALLAPSPTSTLVDIPEPEPKLVKVSASASTELVSTQCQTEHTADEWMLTADAALSVERVGEIEAVVEADGKDVEESVKRSIERSRAVAERLKEETLLWQNDHTTLNLHAAVLKDYRHTYDSLVADNESARNYYDKVTVIQSNLSQLVHQKRKDHVEKLRVRAIETHELISAMLALLATVEGVDAASMESLVKRSKALEADLGPRKTAPAAVPANTPDQPEVQDSTSDANATPEKAKKDAPAGSDPMLPSPPLSPPHAEGEGAQNATPEANGKVIKSVRFSDATQTRTPAHSLETTIDTVNSPGTDEPVTKNQSSSPTDDCLEHDQVIEADATEEKPETPKDEEPQVEIGTDVWSWVAKFKYRSSDDLVLYSNREPRQHFNHQEIQLVTQLLENYTATTSDEKKRVATRALLDAGFPWKPLNFTSGKNMLAVLLDIAEAHKAPTKERCFTRLSPHSYAYATGFSPSTIGIILTQHNWRDYMECILLSSQEKVVLDWAPEEQPKVQANMDVYNETIRRYLGDRDELWEETVPFNGGNRTQPRDYNLIMRRLFENLGLLPFRENSTEGTDINPPVKKEVPVVLPTKPATSTEAIAAPVAKPILPEVEKASNEVPAIQSVVGETSTSKAPISESKPVEVDQCPPNHATISISISDSREMEPSTAQASEEPTTTTIPTSEESGASTTSLEEPTSTTTIQPDHTPVVAVIPDQLTSVDEAKEIPQEDTLSEINSCEPNHVAVEQEEPVHSEVTGGQGEPSPLAKAPQPEQQSPVDTDATPTVSSPLETSLPCSDEKVESQGAIEDIDASVESPQLSSSDAPSLDSDHSSAASEEKIPSLTLDLTPAVTESAPVVSPTSPASNPANPTISTPVKPAAPDWRAEALKEHQAHVAAKKPGPLIDWRAEAQKDQSPTASISIDWRAEALKDQTRSPSAHSPSKTRGKRRSQGGRGRGRGNAA